MAARPAISVLLAFLLLAAGSASPQDTRYPPLGEGVPGPDFCGEAGFLPLGGQIPGPRSPSERAEWLADIRHWRDERLIRAGYNPSEYERTDLAWTRRSFVQHLTMIADRYFYDPVAGRYTVGRHLDDLDRRFGGADSVLLWHSYPNLGIDDRNQYDLVRDMPGGVAGVRSMIDEFHRRGVKVFFPVMLWDQGTRPEGVADATAIARLMAEIGGDGLNGDTLSGFPPIFRDEAHRAGRALALEPTDSPPAMGLAWNVMSWGICWKYSFTPLVSTYKWLEPRHMVHVAPRWGKDKTHDLQFAFFNGVGWVAWENIWGIWNGLTVRDREAMRRVSRVERFAAEFLSSADWEPFAPTEQAGVFASRFPRGRSTIWTFVNRNDFRVAGAELSVPHVDGLEFFDLWQGTRLEPLTRDGLSTLEFAIDANGFGAVLATMAGDRPAGLDELLRDMAAHAATRLDELPKDWTPLPQQIVAIEPSPRAEQPPADMVRIPGAQFPFVVSGIEIEGGESVGVDVQYPWEDSPRRHHRSVVRIDPFFIDRFPVTNAQFKSFLDATLYRPTDPHNFLRDWTGGRYPDGWADKPVTWVSLEDARAYARWAGKRLPREWEWQYAAQGLDGRLYPWGNDWRPGAVPAPDAGRRMRGPDAVSAHPDGASPFGVQDLVGNVWQWTDEFHDERTRAAVLRGGSYYRPRGSQWYFPQAYRLDQHGKYLLMAPSLDRSGGVGFRCVKDAS
jgi:formylglycine-generating enzyme required for sulfatase activity